jgi:hypothetical protein
LDSGIIIVKEEDDLLEPHQPLELVLEGTLGTLGSIGNGDHGPAVANLKDTKAIELTLCDNNGLTLSPKLLPKEGMVFVLSYPPKILLNITSFIRNELSRL